MKIVADSHIPFLKGVLEPFAQVVYLPGNGIGPADARDADALLVRTRTVCDEGLLKDGKVRFIGTATIGHDHIDMEYCRRRNITVATAAGCNASAVTQYVAAVFVELFRRGLFKPEGTTVGIIGAGNVGSRVRTLVRQTGMRAICCDPPKQKEFPLMPFVPLKELLSKADVVTLHVPLTKDGDYPTVCMADADFFQHMRNDAVFVNTSRGQVVDEHALLSVIESGKLNAAALDVWQNEPCINRRLLEKVTLGTPHIAGYSLQGKANATAMIVRQLSGFFGFGLNDWYPEEVAPVFSPKELTWEWLLQEMPRYYDIDADSVALKRHPENFERLRNEYSYREEFF